MPNALERKFPRAFRRCHNDDLHPRAEGRRSGRPITHGCATARVSGSGGAFLQSTAGGVQSKCNSDRRLMAVGCPAPSLRGRLVEISNPTFEGADKALLLPAVAVLHPLALPRSTQTRASWFVRRIDDLKPELPALKRHQHSTELLPGDIPAVNRQQGGLPSYGIVPIDSPPHRLFGDLRFDVFAAKVLDGEHSAKSFDQSPQEFKQIILGIAGDLTLIAGRVAIV